MVDGLVDAQLSWIGEMRSRRFLHCHIRRLQCLSI